MFYFVYAKFTQKEASCIFLQNASKKCIGEVFMGILPFDLFTLYHRVSIAFYLIFENA